MTPQLEIASNCFHTWLLRLGKFHAHSTCAYVIPFVCQNFVTDANHEIIVKAISSLLYYSKILCHLILALQVMTV